MGIGRACSPDPWYENNFAPLTPWPPLPPHAVGDGETGGMWAARGEAAPQTTHLEFTPLLPLGGEGGPGGMRGDKSIFVAVAREFTRTVRGLAPGKRPVAGAVCPFGPGTSSVRSPGVIMKSATSHSRGLTYSLNYCIIYASFHSRC